MSLSLLTFPEVLVSSPAVGHVELLEIGSALVFPARRDRGRPRVRHRGHLSPQPTLACIGVQLCLEPQLCQQQHWVKGGMEILEPSCPQSGQSSHSDRETSPHSLRAQGLDFTLPKGSGESLVIHSGAAGELSHVDARNDTRIALKKGNLGCDS